MNVIKKILSIFINPWFVGLIAFLALAFVIWVFGPLLAFGENYFLEPTRRRWFLIGFVGLAMIVRALWKKFRADKASAQIVEGLVEAQVPAEPNRGEEEVEVLSERFEEAVKLLKKSGGRRSSLYELPWYVIIGPPGSGKTTALLNSGLEFPLADQFGKEALKGVGGTRNCDWWFTNDAVLLDTAGRYTTQDSDAETDSTAWSGFLDLLKTHRKRRPINGVFIAISIQDLLTQNKTERSLHAAAIKRRIQELYEHFGIRFPIYVMLTKADLVNGFMEYFDDLRRSDREQVWGFTLPLLDQDSKFDLEDAFDTEFDHLVDQLSQRLIQRMQQEHDVQRRAQIFGFPRQVAALKPIVHDFLMSIFKPSRYETPFMWRGLYLTSGTQEGTPIDRLLGSMARSFGLQQRAMASHSNQGRSYFIRDMLKKVAFNESQLAGTNRKLEIKRAWLQHASYAAVLLGALGAIALWSISYMNNRGLIADLAEDTEEILLTAAALSNEQEHPLDAIPLLNQVEQMPGAYADRDRGSPWLYGFGLYQGKRVGRVASNAYTRLLGNEYLPRILKDQSNQLGRGWDNDENTFNALKAYLMLDNEHFDPEFVSSVWGLLWEDELNDSSGDQLTDLNRHAIALVNNMPGVLPGSLDDDLIEEVRRDVRRLTPAQRVYGRIKQVAKSHDIEGFSIKKVSGSDASLVFRRKSGRALSDEISGLYTYSGFHKHFDDISQREAKDLNKESWVLGEEVAEEVDQDTLETEVLELYISDYEDNYHDLLADLTIIKPSSLEETVRTLRILSHEKHSPLKKLVEGVLFEIDLQRKDDGALSKVTGVTQKAKSITDRLRQRTGRGPSVSSVIPTTPRQRILLRAATGKLGKLNSMASGEDGDSLFSEVLQLLDDLYVMLDEIEKSSDQAKMAAEHSGQLASVNAELQRITEGQDEAVAGMVEVIVASAKNAISGSTRSYLNDLWLSEVYERCVDTIANRYPFSSTARQEIKLDDFGDFFGQGGVMDNFFTTHLKEYVNTSDDTWRWKSEMRGANPAALVQFARAEQIRRAYFRVARTTPQVRFSVKPLEMDNSITKATFILGNQKITYDHGPQEVRQFSWPGDNSSEVRIELVPQSPAPSATTEDGDWGLFRMLASAQMVPIGGARDRYEVTLNVGSRSVTFEFNPKSSYNPFDVKDLVGFSCPRKL